MQTQKEKKHSESENMVFWNISKEQFIGRVLAFAIIWAILISLSKDWLVGLNPIIQFILATVVAYIIPAILLSHYLDWGSLFNKKTIGAIFLFAGFDLIIPPLSISFDGVFTGGQTFLGTASIDYVISTLFSPYIAGIGLWFATYVLGFLILEGIASYLLTGKQLTEVASL